MRKGKNKACRIISIVITAVFLLSNVNISALALKQSDPIYQQSLDTLYGMTAALKSDGTVLVTKSSYISKEYQPDTSKWKNIVQISAGDMHILGLKKDGTVVASGGNDRGQSNVSGWKDIVQVCTGYNTSLGLKSDGTVVSAGLEDSLREELAGWKNIKKLIAAESSSVIGIDNDGGIHFAGYMGSSDYEDTFIKAFATWTDIVDIILLGPVAVGLRTDGTLVTVGEETDSYYVDRTKLSNWKNIVQISSGRNHVIGLKADGTVVGVGTPKFRNFGQYNVGKWKNIREIAAGEYFSVGLQDNGKLVFTGENPDGQGNVTTWKNLKVPPKKQLSKAKQLPVNQLNLKLEGKPLEKVKPYYDELNRIRVPIKAFSEALGAKVTAGSGNSSMDITWNNRKIKFTKGKQQYRVNDLLIDMGEDTVVTTKNNTLNVPVNFISQALGCDTSYDPATKTVSIIPIKRKAIPYTVVGAKAFTGKTRKVGPFTCPEREAANLAIYKSSDERIEVKMSVEPMSTDPIDKQIDELANILVQKVDEKVVRQIIEYIMPKITAYTENEDRTYEIWNAYIFDKKSGRYIEIEEGGFVGIDINYTSEAHTKNIKNWLK